MTPQQYADDLIATSWKVADLYDISTLNDVFIEIVDASIWHSLRNYWPTNSYADFTDFAFQAESLLSIQKGSGKIQTSKYPNTHLTKPYTRKPWYSRNVASNVNTESMSTSSQRTEGRSPSPKALKMNALSIWSSGQGSTQGSFSSMTSAEPSFCKVCYDSSYVTPKCPLLTQGSFAQLGQFVWDTCRYRQADNVRDARNCLYTFRGSFFCNRGRGGSSSSDRNSRISQTEKTATSAHIQKNWSKRVLRRIHAV